ncbi:hypothetical protein HBH58_177770 [Parastagonospora nodorum]|nr:hypothetical protein HBH58_177770 [Parastagonospora nodorum]
MSLCPIFLCRAIKTCDFARTTNFKRSRSVMPQSARFLKMAQNAWTHEKALEVSAVFPTSRSERYTTCKYYCYIRVVVTTCVLRSTSAIWVSAITHLLRIGGLR